jgi:hypothetical protein
MYIKYTTLEGYPQGFGFASGSGSTSPWRMPREYGQMTTQRAIQRGNAFDTL